MRSSLEARLHNVWYGSEDPPLALRALVPVYRSLTRLDRWRQQRKKPERPEDCCIIVVGNLTAGGSGKTPLVIHLAELFQSKRLKTGVISRGYGRQGRGLVQVDSNSPARTAGDEPLMIARRSGVPVAVCENRLKALDSLRQQGCKVVISDDGLQHHRLPRHIEICMVSGADGFGNGQLLPAGPLREELTRLETVDFIVCSGDCPSSLPQPAARMDLVPELLHALNGRQTWRLSQYAGCTVNAVAGIARPERFFRVLEQSRIRPIEHRFPDHHPFTKSDFEALDQRYPIIMTEKDAVKCAPLDLDNAWYLSVSALLPGEFEQRLLRQVVRHFSNHARNDGH